MYAGDIAAAIGLKDTSTGDTLCDEDQPDHPRGDEVPGAGDRRRHRAEDQGRPGQAGQRAAEAGRRRSDLPRAHRRRRRARRSSAGMGELHLEIIVDRMLREFKVDANVGRPQVAYRETIRKTVEERRRQVRPPDRRPRPVRSRGDQHRAAASRAPASSSRTRSSAARSRASTSSRSSRASRKRWRRACSPAIRWST